MALPQPAPDPTAVFGRRVLAALIDAAVVIIPAILILTASFQYLDVSELTQDPQAFCDAYTAQTDGLCVSAADVDDRVYFTDDVSSASTTYYWGASFLFLVVLQGLTGWTIGKLLVGIRTVREDGRRPGVPKALVRWLLWVIDGFPYVLPLLGFIVGLTTQGHRRVGDMVAKTYVVRRSAAGASVVVPGMGLPPVPASSVPAYPSASSGSPSSTLSPSGPQWDAARNTYIQWDPAQSAWFQWDEGARAWTPISGA